jgi:hypothetical protein
MGNVKVNGQEVEIMKDAVAELVKLLYAKLEVFIGDDTTDEDERMSIFMHNVTRNLMGNLLIQASNGDTEKFKKISKAFLMQLEEFFNDVIPVLSKRQQNEVH